MYMSIGCWDCNIIEFLAFSLGSSTLHNAYKWHSKKIVKAQCKDVLGKLGFLQKASRWVTRAIQAYNYRLL